MIDVVAQIQEPAAGLAAAVAEVRAGRFPAAWSAAQLEPLALERAQALAYVRHHAGDLEGALQLAEDGLRSHPGDAWLRHTALEVALALHLGARAAGHLEARGAVSEPELRVEVSRLLDEESRAVAGVRRARAVTAVAGGILLVLLLNLGRRVR